MRQIAEITIWATLLITSTIIFVDAENFIAKLVLAAISLTCLLMMQREARKIPTATAAPVTVNGPLTIDGEINEEDISRIAVGLADLMERNRRNR